MKKKLFVLILAVVSNYYFTQSNKVSIGNMKKNIVGKQKTASQINSPAAVSGNIICYGYLASSTQTLDLTLSMTRFYDVSYG